MNSTIHDLYFSDTNFNYIYDLISKIVLNDTKFNISNNSKIIFINHIIQHILIILIQMIYLLLKKIS